MKKLIVVLLLPLSACAATIEPQGFKGPSGKQAYTMQCSGLGRTLDKCYKKAGEICPNGYNVVDRSSVPTAVAGSTIITKTTLAIECR